MKALTVIALILSTIACAGVGFSLLNSNSTTHVCIVRMHEVMDRYEGALDAGSRMRRSDDAIQSNIDSLVRGIQSEQNETDVEMKRARIQQYVKVVEQKAEQDKAEISKRLVSHIRSAAETISEQRQLQLVLAITDDSFVLSKTAVVDITEDVLRELKRTYRNEFK